MDLMFGLATVDTMQGDKAARRLYAGWTGQESATGRKVRRTMSAALVALAARLAPVEEYPVAGRPSLAGTGRA